MDMELINKIIKAVRLNLIHIVRRGIFQEVIPRKNPKTANQNHIHMESLAMGKVNMVPWMAMENLTVIRNPRAVNQNHIHMESLAMGKVNMVPWVAMENLTVIKKVLTEAMARVLLSM